MKVNGLIVETGTYRICYGDEAIYTLDTATGLWTEQIVAPYMDGDTYTQMRRGAPGALNLDDSRCAMRLPEADTLTQQSGNARKPRRSDFTVVKR